MRSLILITLVSTIFVSCISYREVQLTSFSLRDMNTSSGKIRATFDLEADNPNAFSVKLSKPRLVVSLANEELKDWSTPKKLVLKRRSKQTYPFYVEVSGAEVVKLAPRLLFNPHIKIVGTIKVGSFIFGKRIPVSIEQNLY